MDTKECNKYFYEDLRTLTDLKVNPKCKSNIVNHVVFAFIILVVVGAISAYIMKNNNILIVFLVLGVLHASYWYTRYDSKAVVQEPFKVEKAEVPDGVMEEVIGKEVTLPSNTNPFMNVLVDEIKYNPKRAPAASVLDPSVSVQLDDFFKTQFVNDPTDVFNRSQSQRQFYTNPSTSVPNDVDSYQNWLYRIPGKTCKEGSRNCVSGSEGGTLPWLNLGS